ncbi:hypothetical protein Tco_0232715 [Tanacetum coccineum]
MYAGRKSSLSSFIRISKGGSSSIFTFFNLPAEAGEGSAPVSFSSGGRGCYRLKIHQLDHNQLLKSQRQQLSGQLCFFVTHLRVPYQYHDLTE